MVFFRVVADFRTLKLATHSALGKCRILTINPFHLEIVYLPRQMFSVLALQVHE